MLLVERERAVHAALGGHLVHVGLVGLAGEVEDGGVEDVVDVLVADAVFFFWDWLVRPHFLI